MHGAPLVRSASVDPDDEEPPDSVTYELEEALELLSVLESARTTFRDTAHFAGVVEIGDQIRLLTRRLGFDEGGFDGD